MPVEKSALRRDAQARRQGLASPGFAAALAAHAAALELPPGAIVAGYAPFRDEADPRALMAALAARGHPLALPRIVGKDRPLVFHRWQDGDSLSLHRFGMAEPLATAPQVVPQVLLLPLLAFDGDGWRLGYGGGFYDCTLAGRTLAGLAASAIGIAYAGQQIAAVPHAAHDRRLDAVLTETGLIRFA